jgi:formate hydrogenlyase subunit 3/multisubunit Na+/H+ antiporter MnhD subunit
MRIDMKREAELNQRQGLTRRTVLAIVWLFACLIGAYLVTGWLISIGLVDEALVYDTLSIPPNVSLEAVRLASTLLLAFLLQFVTVIVYAMTNPAAKQRSGLPTAAAQAPDYYEYEQRASR